MGNFMYGKVLALCNVRSYKTICSSIFNFDFKMSYLIDKRSHRQFYLIKHVKYHLEYRV